MKSYIERVMEEHPNWPRRVWHGEYIGVLSGAAPLGGGEYAALYRFPGGECHAFGAPAVRTPPTEEDGAIKCGCCGGGLLRDKYGKLPDLCPACHEGVDWSAWEESGALKPGDKVVMNGNYHVSEENRGKVWRVRSEPWLCCGTLVVLLEGKSGGYSVDGLDLVKEAGEIE